MQKRRLAFWQPAANYYVLAVAISAAFFFIAWGLLNESGEEMPWIPAGIGASTILAAAVVVRGIVMRQTGRLELRTKQLDEARAHAASLRAMQTGARDGAKLTIEQNAVLVNEIHQKAEAAKLLNRFSASHREVFEMCVEYLTLNERELTRVNPNSPRLPPLLRGRSSVAEYQRFHLLKWAEIETRNLTAEAHNRAAADERIEAAQTALGVLQRALQFYPAERTLIDSHSLVTELVVSIKVREWMHRAGRAAYKGDFAKAKIDYECALNELASVNIVNPAREEAARRIVDEIAHLDSILNGRGGDLGKDRID